ncbi:MAG TPA: 3-hydroxyacyl-CoA dehydrogenase NAD-binding domain-containing protein [Caulobacteraceae bacterium]|nr:3-hydroxyacyl-CoA dehydrogenase NAD-binding domain-containing protein [Caulobacteraceae bacterium]
MSSPVQFDVCGDIAVLTLDAPPVNALGHALRAAILESVKRAEAAPEVVAIVLTTGGKLFSAGADITEFGKPPQAPSLPEALEVVETSSKPIVAAIRGAAFGGGLELPLACHYRVGAPSAKLGLPEVTLGILPGAGGTQRLPRIVGARKALDMITSGAPVAAKAALDMGLLDAITTEDGLKEEAIAFARQVVAEGRPLKKVRDNDDKIAADRGHPEIFADFRKSNAKKFRGAEAPEASIQAVEAAVNLPFDEGLALERELFVKLRDGDQAAAQRHAFFAERQVWKIPDVPDDTPTLPVRKVGVIGAGTMGGGIAMNFANVGIPVVIIDAAQDGLDRGLGVVRKNYERSRSNTPDMVEARMALFTPSLDYAALADCDLVIEAVFETIEVKNDVFGRVNKVVRPDAIIASNTSYLDIDEIAKAVDRPERFIGLHFFSPANVMKLLEVVRGAKTSKPVIATAMQLAKKIGKTAVLVGVCYGFVGNRLLAQRQREAEALLVEGALPWQVDKVITDFGQSMGPFAMRDLAGLDVGWVKEKSTSSTVREILNEMDRRGQKTGAGFYDYDENRVAKPSALVEQIVLDFSNKAGIERRAISDEEILERCLYPMVNEGAKILEEGKAIRASDIDVVWLNGYGWPRYRGGPMWWGEQVGLPKILAAMRRYEAMGKPEFKPSALLERLAAEGKGFSDI